MWQIYNNHNICIWPKFSPIYINMNEQKRWQLAFVLFQSSHHDLKYITLFNSSSIILYSKICTGQGQLGTRDANARHNEMWRQIESRIAKQMEILERKILMLVSDRVAFM